MRSALYYTRQARREATVEVEKTAGAVVQALPTGAVVQVFMLARSVPADAWSESGPGDPS